MSHFKTTTPRSARIGLEGHSTDKDWIHFTEKYRSPCMKFLDRHYPKYRFLKDDVYEDMVVMILDNPGFANRKPSVRFRTVLIKLLRKAMASAVRKLREESGERYARLMQPLLPSETAFNCDRRRRNHGLVGGAALLSEATEPTVLEDIKVVKESEAQPERILPEPRADSDCNLADLYRRRFLSGLWSVTRRLEAARMRGNVEEEQRLTAMLEEIVGEALKVEGTTGLAPTLRSGGGSTG